MGDKAESQVLNAKFTWMTEESMGEIHAIDANEVLRILVMGWVWPPDDTLRLYRRIAVNGWLQVFDCDGNLVLRRGITPS